MATTDAATARFEARFGRAPTAGARAPGRVNLIGEHTDYNAGLVLPCAIDRDCVVWLAPRDDERIRLVSREEEAEAELALQAPDARPSGSWTDYVRGVIRTLLESGAALSGVDLAVASDVPVGAGLSSSAALQLAVVTALDAAFGLGLEPEARARLVHRAENDFVGVPCGIMDPYASALGRRGHALRIDCRSGEWEHVPMPVERLALLVADTGVRRALATGDYGDRVVECRDAFDVMCRRGLVAADAGGLRDVEVDDLAALEAELPETLAARVRHVVTENARVEATCGALRAGDVARVGELLREGMRSLRRDYEVSTVELDALCEIADEHPGVFGSRLTGAGFGGCTIHAVDPAAAPQVASAIQAGFRDRFGRRPSVWAVRPSDGAEVL